MTILAQIDPAPRSWFFAIPHSPRAKNTRHTSKRGFQFVPAETKQWQSLVALCAAQVLPVGRIEGALRLEFLAVLERPQRLSKDTRKTKHPGGLLLAPTVRRLDLENIAKGLNDGLSRWFDDGQITDLVARKRYAERDGAPRIEVTITVVGEDGDAEER